MKESEVIVTTTIMGPEQQGQCELFGDFGIFIQTVLGVLSILSLFCKNINHNLEQ
jgi:hypothetical protein